MIIIGLVGGVACGKSHVAGDFQTLGACVLSADRIGHQVLQIDRVKQALGQRWGDAVVDAEGELCRSALAKIVFRGDPKAMGELAFLESVTHPEITRILEARIAELDKLGCFPFVVLDAAVMMKTGWDKLCDQLVFVEVPRALRVERGRLRGLDEAQFSAREAAQTPLAEKKARADLMIDNSGTPQQTFQQVQKVWRSLVEIA